MGYLITGRIGTGKTFVVQCWAGEIGIPCVVFKNFRDRWVGATESNLEKIFARAARASARWWCSSTKPIRPPGKREGGDGDSGLSGRVYSMLAKEMSDTRNRGRIIWVFATSRPDLLEVDLKRQGRLDVHIPLFPPRDARRSATALLLAIAKKLKFPLTAADLPPLADGVGARGERAGRRPRQSIETPRIERRSRGGRFASCSPTCFAKSGPAPTHENSNTWIWWRSRNAPTRAFCRSGSAICRRRSSKTRIDALRRFV